MGIDLVDFPQQLGRCHIQAARAQSIKGAIENAHDLGRLVIDDRAALLVP